MIVKNDVYDYKNRFIFQDTNSFKFSVDSILLAEFVQPNIKNNQVILDLCSGNMVIPLILSTYCNNKIYGFEIQNDIFDLGLKSIEINKLDNQLTLYNADAKDYINYFKCESVDVVVCNPPFFRVNESSSLNISVPKRIARHEVAIDLENIFSIASKLLTTNGCLYLVHRSDRLDEICTLGFKYHVGVKEIQLITTKQDVKPRIVLLKCVKNSSLGVKINNEICIDGLKSYQNMFKESK